MNASLLLTEEYWLTLLEGLPVTLLLTTVSVLLGAAIALPVAILRNSSRKCLRWAGTAYVFLFRGVPTLLLLFFIYYALPQLSVLRGTWFWDIVLENAWVCAALAISLANGAYMGEVFRSGLLAVPAGEIEAALTIGMTRPQIFRRVILLHVLRASLLAFGNEVVFTVKASVLASIVTVYDVMGQAGLIQERTASQFAPLIGTALIYIVLVQLIEAVIRTCDGRLHPERNRRRSVRSAQAVQPASNDLRSISLNTAKGVTSDK